MRRYAHNNSVLIFLFSFVHFVFSQLSPNQISTMTKLYGMIQNDTGSSFPWHMVNKGSNPCSWAGVSCPFLMNESSASVVGLHLLRFSISSPDILPVLCQIDTLEYLDLSYNNLSLIPDGFITSCGVIKGLQVLNFRGNKLAGPLPTFSGFPVLKVLDLSHNSLSGTIIFQLRELDSLWNLDLSNNSFTGPVPTNLGKSNLLQNLRLCYNYFEGEIPGELTKFGNLKVIDVSFNRLSGSIPDSLDELSKLQDLILSSNNFVGKIPPGITKYIRHLNLCYNNLTGSIPDGILLQPNLRDIDLSSNRLGGPIPAAVSSGSCSLISLKLENNRLIGQIPRALGECTSLEFLNLGQNRLKGILPPELGNLMNLRVLKLERNNLVRRIPHQFSDLQKLEVLDLSNNRISGVIPNGLTRMERLNQLLLQNNQLSGVIPPFHPSVMVVLSGNKDLTNRTEIEDPNPEQLEGSHIDYVLIASIFSGFVFGLSLVSIIPYMPRYSKAIKWHWIANNSIHKTSLNFSEAMKAISRPTNMFLKSEFSTYYKAAMPCGMNYCIRKLYWSSKSFSLLSPKEFASKIEVLGHLKNSNIISPLAYAFTVQNTFIAYEWPEQGTLFDLLHGNNKNVLTWKNRYEIAVGVAKGLAFLHGFCFFGRAPFVLHHLSTRSIFMKSISEPLIGDFELSMVINPSKSLETLSVVAGNVGYIPPEYAYIMRVTMAGNIYSYGVVLLELLTGKKAINEGVILAKWVLNKSIENEVDEILDQRVICSAEVHQQMLSMLRTALCCIDASAEERPEARGLLAMLLDVPP